MHGRFPILVLLAAVMFASPTRADELKGRRPIYHLTVMSWWAIPFRNVVRQEFDFSCGSAALATLLTYQYNRPTPEQTTFASMWQHGDQSVIRKLGFSMLDMKFYLASVGYHAEGLRMDRSALEALRRPAIVLLNMNGFKHFVVVKGVQDGRVLIGDPMLGIKQYSEPDFMKMWNSIALVIADNDPSARYNAASDWSPWSRAPIASNLHNVEADNYFMHLPAIYQLLPEIAIEAHVGTLP